MNYFSILQQGYIQCITPDKRKNKIFLGCLLLLVTLSVGYAAFSENVLVTGTSKSQGTFDITATCYTGVAGFFTNRYADDSNGYNSDTCSVSGNSVNFSLLDNCLCVCKSTCL